MHQVRAKKNLGQHFLKDPEIANEIATALEPEGRYKDVLEIGPGMGILTGFLFSREDIRCKALDIDDESIEYLRNHFPFRQNDIIHDDFLKADLSKLFPAQFAIIGNFPYNISSQILFKVLDYRDRIPEVVGMFQKEVAERIAGNPGSRDYGILSVFMQAWYDVKLIMQLNENDFSPPPKVKSAVLRFERKENFKLPCDEKLFRTVVKAAFNQRRKTLRNAMTSVVGKENADKIPFSGLRAEALTWQQFTELTNFVAALKTSGGEQ